LYGAQSLYLSSLHFSSFAQTQSKCLLLFLFSLGFCYRLVAIPQSLSSFSPPYHKNTWAYPFSLTKPHTPYLLT
jgi:hypothetical protein